MFCTDKVSTTTGSRAVPVTASWCWNSAKFRRLAVRRRKCSSAGKSEAGRPRRRISANVKLKRISVALPGRRTLINDLGPRSLRAASAASFPPRSDADGAPRSNLRASRNEPETTEEETFKETAAVCSSLLPSPAPSQVSHLDVELRVLVVVVEERLVVPELSVPLARLHEAEVVAERNEKHRRAEETRLLPVLIQQEQSADDITATSSELLE
ncbi:hypothetical protein EYF80_010437 [Liparis tanakae]|uniref:Uncharacterized protein n=1 Tax=Liparis tanakae TaxID=230148 RepID=A0A4Z2IQH7_9TELE|nr:hypothetical protein EYF80_010437 [Liparis tanakae]